MIKRAGYLFGTYVICLKQDQSEPQMIIKIYRFKLIQKFNKKNLKKKHTHTICNPGFTLNLLSSLAVHIELEKNEKELNLLLTDVDFIKLSSRKFHRKLDRIKSF